MSDPTRPPVLILATSSETPRPVSTSPSPHHQSQYPSRYLHSSDSMNEKATFSSDATSEAKSRSPSDGPSVRPQHQSFSRGPSHISTQPAILPIQRLPCQSQSYIRPRGLRITNLIRPWLPIILYALTSLIFLIAIAFYKAELFSALDELSRWLQADETYGQAVLFFLIFLTTFPPVPLYSTLIILSGYTFGPWTGAVISYFAALSGALVVFLLSRTLLRETISRWLSSTCTLKRVVGAIEKRPKLLFLIRLAPYPYNVMNCLLAASPTLTLRTYTICTALSLFKVIIHSSLGASIHSFKDYHMTTEGDTHPDSGANTVARMWTILGIALCVAIFIYLSYVARKAVDEELEEYDDEETVSFLSAEGHGDLEQCDNCIDDQPTMTQSHPHQLISPRPSMSLDIYGQPLRPQFS
ncbi:MAG: hypothetical protein NXY57DRAFT_989586 [Lentinula lateritia]|uniref:Golgi apparatus membrane protein TVP38 n=1 Tax=Lentinula lateritia TaxID=40482 RepID=A0ABQ8V9Z0_9AGAR|nr:MAG: hypothetical protein NXY57DRAFT_989586 [Lentinula lateritia]KAJ4473497.1 hypothetical protein C8R41DRAFT_848934 [Lentinula lateritia]